MAKSNKQVQGSIKKEDFIDFLASATPEDINRMIREKGKPRKLIEPMVFFKREDNKVE